MACVGGAAWGIWSGSTFQMRARSLMCSGLSQLRKAGHLAVGPALARVLSGRLPVHLEERRAGLADHAPDDVQVIHLDSRCCGLVRLVYPLQHRRNERGRRAEDVRCLRAAVRQGCL